MEQKGYHLSKTSFLKFEQCDKAYFFYNNHPYLRDKPGMDKQLTFRRGHDVGFLARSIFPGGVDVFEGNRTLQEAVAETGRLVNSRAPVIYEAAFVYNGVLVLLDILCLDEDGYRAYEVKSSLKISEIYLKDAYLQYYVLHHALSPLRDLFLVTLNGDYVRHGPLDVKKLFKRRSVKDKALLNFGYFENRIEEARITQERQVIPNTPVGMHCFRPYQCDFFGTCWKGVIESAGIFRMPLVNRAQIHEWHAQGIRSIGQLSDEMLGKESLKHIRDALISGKPYVNREKIRQFLERITGTVAAMDMEIWAPAIPPLEGTSPFEQIPFLFCLFNGQTDTYFFTGHESDERRAFAEALISMTVNYDTLLVYDQTMEAAAISQLSRLFPDLAAQLAVVAAKMADLFKVILEVAFYDPRFEGNFSLKAVSSALLDDALYTGINSGLEAMNVYDAFRTNENIIEKEEYSARLIQYCAADARATFGIVEYLRSV